MIRAVARHTIPIAIVLAATSAAALAATDEIAEAWSTRADRAAKRLTQPGLDACDVAYERAFQRAKEDAYARLNDTSPYKVSLAWFRRPVEEQKDILGDDAWPYGLEKNRHVVSTLMSYLYEQGLAQEKIDVEQLFAPNTLDL